jgi:hypothetical protein
MVKLFELEECKLHPAFDLKPTLDSGRTHRAATQVRKPTVITMYLAQRSAILSNVLESVARWGLIF